MILLEIDPDKFPSPDKSNGLFDIFDDDSDTSLASEFRLFYVAITRAREKLFIFSSSRLNPEHYSVNDFILNLNNDWIRFNRLSELYE